MRAALGRVRTPCVRCEQVFLLLPQRGEPFALPVPVQVGRRALRKSDVVQQMPRAHVVALPRFVQLFRRILTHRLEHPVARVRLRVAVDDQQRLVVQRRQPFQRVVLVRGVAADVRRGGQRASAGEHGEAAKQPPFRCGQKVVAPLHRRMQRLVTRHRAVAAGQ